MGKASEILTKLMLDNSNYIANLEASRERLNSFAASAAAVGRTLTVAGGGILTAAMLAVRSASKVEETLNKFNVVFAESATNVKAWADFYAREVGRSQELIASFLADAQDLFIPLGFDSGPALEMSKTITKLALDLASFNNKADSEPMIDLRAALTGSGEVMKKYGVIVNETTVAQNLLNSGINPQKATEQQKVFARLNIILAGTKAAHGDAVRSAGAFANQLKRLEGEVFNASSSIGDALLPAATNVVAAFAAAAEGVNGFAKANPELIQVTALAGATMATLGVAFLGAAAAAKVAAFALAGKVLIVRGLSQVAAPAVRALAGVSAAMNMFNSGNAAAGVEMVLNQLKIMPSVATRAAASIILMGNAEAAAAAKSALSSSLKAASLALAAMPARVTAYAASLSVASVAAALHNATAATGAAIMNLCSLSAGKAAAMFTLSGAGATVAGIGAKIAAGGFLAASVAANALNSALAFMLANPLVVVFAAIAAAVIALAAAFNSAANEQEQLTAAMLKCNEANTGYAKKNLAQKDDYRSEDAARLARIKELAAAQSLNSVEQSEAGALLDTLSRKYGDLGVSIDSATGKLTGFSDAQNKVNTDMYADEKKDLDVAIAAAEKEIADRQAILDKAPTFSFSWRGDQKNAAKRIRLHEETNVKRDELDDLKDRRLEVGKRSVAAQNNVSAPEAQKAAAELDETAEKLRSDKLSPLQKELEELDKVHESRLKNLELLQKYHGEQAEAAKLKIADLEGSGNDVALDRAIELLKIEEAGALAAKEKLAAAKLDFDAAKSAAKEKAKEELTALRNGFSATKIDREKGNLRDEESRSLNKLQELNPITYLRAIESLAAAAKMQQKAAEVSTLKAIDEAEKDGELSPDERENIEKQREVYEAATNRFDDLQKKIQESAQSAVSSSSAIGGFDVDVLRRTLAGDLAKDQLSVMRTMSENTYNILHTLESVSRRLAALEG